MAEEQKVLLPHQQRVVAELDELEDKMEKLNAFLARKQNTISEDEEELLEEQAKAMAHYAVILRQRIALWS